MTFQDNDNFLRGTKTRRVATADLIGKFRSKSDFIKYLTENRKYFRTR